MFDVRKTDAAKTHAGRRPHRRFVGVLALTTLVLGITALLSAAAPVPQSGPALTTVSDTVYRADGTPAQGTLVITWPAFVSAGGTAIAAGVNNVTLGTSGHLSAALVPNTGANPAGVYYTVVYQLNDGTTRTEYWLVPTSSPANLATVRTTPGSGIAAQPVSMQYVNTALATKANDNAVVHLAATETITGTKTFAAVPNVPAPANSGDVANKGYVDNAVSNVGSGNFVPLAGGAMTGPLTLSGSPVAALQAAPKQYVDTGLATKADLVSGRVPASELGTGTANSGACLFGNATWGTCGNVSTTPSATQAIAEPAGAVFTANRIGQKRMADQFNWKQSPTTPAALAPGAVTVTLSPCPQGFLNTINASNSNHWIYVDSSPGDAQQPGEPVLITGENCAAGSASGTITFSAAYAHAAGYSLESGTGGIKEALVDANQVRYNTVAGNNTWVELTPNQVTTMKAPLYWQTTMGRLAGSSLIECTVNMSCINLGDTNSGAWANGNSNTYTNNVVDGFWMRPSASMAFWDVAPSTPTTIGAGSTSATLQISTCPTGFWPLIPNQILWLNGTSGGLVTTAYEAGAPGPGEFVQVTGGTCTPGATNGTINIAPATPGQGGFWSHGAGYTLSNGATAYIEDNSEDSVISNIQINGWMAAVGYGFVIQNDNNQAETVTNVSVMGGGGVRCDNDFCGATLFGPGPNTFNAGITTFMGGTSGACAEWYDGNDLSIGPTVCQGFANYAIFMSTKRGGSLQHAVLHTVHRERGGANNSLGIGLGAADMIVQGYSVTVDGNGDGFNAFPSFAVAGNPGGQLQAYYLAIMDVSDGTKTVPIPLGTANVTNPNANNVTVKWVTADALSGKTINFELYRVALLAGVPGIVPNPSVCDGLNGDPTCLVATNIVPATICDIHGACTFTDNVQTPTAANVYTGIDGAGTGYYPTNSFSPGGIVLSNTATYQGEPACLVVMGGWLNNFASIFDNEIAPGNCVPSGGSFNPALTGFSNGAGGYAQWGLLLPDRNRLNDGGSWTNLKGRINLIGGGAYPRDAFTWVDSNPAKTMGSKLEYGSGALGSVYGSVNRPQWDVGDVATGVENSGTGLYNRVPANGVFDWYVGALPNNPGATSTNWTEELSTSGHTFNEPVTVNGNLTVTGTCTGCGGGGSGTVNSGTASQVAVYPGNGAAVSGDSSLTDSGTTLNYAGTGGISATAGTFSGNVTVNGQLMVAGPWMVSSPIPGSPMGPAGAGASALGISNDGNFYISANAGTPQKVATTATSSYFSNLIQEDANDIGENNGTNAQGLHVYGTYTNASNYERTGLGWDATDGYFVVKNENAGTGSQRGIGFWIGSGVRWAIDTVSTLKPGANNSFNIGTTTFAPQTIYAATSFDTLAQGRENFELCNDGTTGTSLNFLAVYNGATPACAVKAGTAATDGVIGVVSNGSGTSGFAVITYRGYVQCSFDGATTAGDFVVASTTNAGDCHDAGATRPTGVQVIGRVESTNSALGTYGVRASLEPPDDSSTTPVTSAFGRSGAVTAQSGDYSVTQVTNAAQAQSCTNKVLNAVNNSASSSNCVQVTPSYASSVQGNASTFQLATGGASGDYASFDANLNVKDSGVTAGPYAVPWFTTNTTGTAISFSSTANRAELWGVALTFPLSTTQVTYYVSTADNTANTYDIGVLNSSGNVVAHIGNTAGTTFAPNVGWKTLNWAASATLQPGKYYLAITSSCTSTCAQMFGGTSAGFTFLGGPSGTAESVSAGGTLNNGITIPADNPTEATIMAWEVH